MYRNLRSQNFYTFELYVITDIKATVERAMLGSGGVIPIYPKTSIPEVSFRFSFNETSRNSEV